MTKFEEHLRKENERLCQSLAVLLDSVDYERGACSPTEMVGAVIPIVVLRQCRESVAACYQSHKAKSK